MLRLVIWGKKKGFTGLSSHRLSDTSQPVLGFSVRAQKTPLALVSDGTSQKIATQCNRHFLCALSEQSGNEREMLYQTECSTKAREMCWTCWQMAAEEDRSCRKDFRLLRVELVRFYSLSTSLEREHKIYEWTIVTILKSVSSVIGWLIKARDLVFGYIFEKECFAKVILLHVFAFSPCVCCQNSCSAAFPALFHQFLTGEYKSVLR